MAYREKAVKGQSKTTALHGAFTQASLSPLLLSEVPLRDNDWSHSKACLSAGAGQQPAFPLTALFSLALQKSQKSFLTWKEK